MFKKILFVSLVVLFSTTLIPKDKVFLDISFLTGISDKVERACELKKNGKSVKSDKILNDVNKEMDLYLSKFNFFYLDKSCPLVWNKNNGAGHGGQLQCMPQIHIMSIFGDIIKKNILEEIEELGDKETAIFSGNFKILRRYYSLEREKVSHSISIACYPNDSVDSDEKQIIEIYASPVIISK